MSKIVFVLGHRGMLGSTVVRHFMEQGFTVRTSDKRHTLEGASPLLEEVRASDARYVINAIGKIPQRGPDQTELYAMNAGLPRALMQTLRPDQYLLHASTDCVYTGERGSYRVDEAPNAVDDYGKSKAEGEAAVEEGRGTVVRVSIIGLTPHGAHGLLGWFLSQPEDAAVSGYTNHWWNGITTLEWAKVAERLIEAHAEGERLPRLLQPGSERVSKYDLLRMTATAFGTSHSVTPVSTDKAVDRTLHPTHEHGALLPMLVEFARWYAAAPTGTASV